MGSTMAFRSSRPLAADHRDFCDRQCQESWCVSAGMRHLHRTIQSADRPWLSGQELPTGRSCEHPTAMPVQSAVGCQLHRDLHQSNVMDGWYKGGCQEKTLFPSLEERVVL